MTEVMVLQMSAPPQDCSGICLPSGTRQYWRGWTTASRDALSSQPTGDYISLNSMTYVTVEGDPGGVGGVEPGEPGTVMVVGVHVPGTGTVGGGGHWPVRVDTDVMVKVSPVGGGGHSPVNVDTDVTVTPGEVSPPGPGVVMVTVEVTPGGAGGQVPSVGLTGVPV